MKPFIKYFSLFVVFAIFMLGMSVRLYDYNNREIGKHFKKGKYTFDKNFTFLINDTIIRNKTNSECNYMWRKLMKLHQNNIHIINPSKDTIMLKNKFIDIVVVY